MSKPLRTAAHAGRECPRCAETVLLGQPQCSFCGHALRSVKSPSTRLLEVGSLAVVLGLIVGACSVLGHMIGV